jgi:outer membrane protein assembly factor BamA
VPVSEGMLYRVGQVEVHDGLSAATRDEREDGLIADSGLKAGATYSQQKIEVLRNGLSLASRTAFAPSAVDVSQQLDTTNGTANTIFSVHSQNPYILRRLNFSGERRFSDRYYGVAFRFAKAKPLALKSCARDWSD